MGMQIALTVDLTGATPDKVLNLVYSSVDNNNTRYSYSGDGEKVNATLDGALLLSQAEYNAIVALPHTLEFAKPPVP